MNNFTISVIIPCFNEEGNVLVLADKLICVLKKYEDYELLFVDDGSTDKTLKHIKELAAKDHNIKYISFSRSFGHQQALKAGFDHAVGDCVISMDSDLQHPVELIDQMIQKWREGFEVIYTIREDSPELPLFKRFTSNTFYKFINRISNTTIPERSADFRLLDRVVVDVLKDINENFLFVRGIISWVGFKQYGIRYAANDRLFGKTKYSRKKMFLFALNGITSFSIKPLHIATLLGLTISLASFCYGFYAIIMKLLTNRTVPGWSSVLVSVLFIGGLQLLVLGILGEYIGKLFIESKKRPNYIIKDKKL